jgi:four helix bundle protein
MILANQGAQAIFERIKKLIKLTIAITDKLPKTTAAFKIAGQVIDSVTSIGANFVEAQSARSKKEFISVINITLREAKETVYWFEIISDTGLFPEVQVKPLTKEAEELVKIFASTVLTASRSLRDNSNRKNC